MNFEVQWENAGWCKRCLLMSVRRCRKGSADSGHEAARVASRDAQPGNQEPPLATQVFHTLPAG